MRILETRDLQINLNGFCLENLKFYLDEGEYVALLGPSGSGKTVLLETIAGRYSYEGSLRLRGKEARNIEAEERDIGLVYQDYILFPRMTVLENIILPLQCRHKNMSEARKRALKLMNKMGIEALKNRYPKHLSGGEKQRVALARALIFEPDLLLLDEPLSALDQDRRQDLKELLKSIHEKTKVSILHVTHDLAEVQGLAERYISIASQKEAI